MEVVIKVYVGLFMLLYFVFTAGGIVNTQMKVAHAQDYKNDVIAVLENSNFHSDVARSCIEEGEKRGYQIEIYEYDKSGRVYELSADTFEMAEEIVMAKVILAFSYSFNPFSTDTKCELWGYTR